MNHESILNENLPSLTNALQLALGKLRKNLGFRSSRAFFEKYLCERTRLDFNYSYYMKIEGGKIVPSAQIINNLCQALEPHAGQEVLLSYCATLFPDRAQVFQKLKNTSLSKPKSKKEISVESDLAQSAQPSNNQTFLTQAQVACVVKSKLHYFSFLILTLARRLIKDSELKSALVKSNPKVSEVEFDLILEDLLRAKLIRVVNDEIESIANEMRFPKADSDSLKKTYEQMDSWESKFNQEMHFEPVIQKMMVRRVSARYLSLIQAHSNVMIDLIRSADELNPDHNDDVLMLNFSLQKGHLPG